MTNAYVFSQETPDLMSRYNMDILSCIIQVHNLNNFHIKTIPKNTLNLWSLTLNLSPLYFKFAHLHTPWWLCVDQST